MNSEALEKLACMNYQAYNISRGGLAYDGSPIPDWSDVAEPIKQGWREGTRAVVESTEGFIQAFNSVQELAHDVAASKGWWDDGERNFGETTALIISELSEGLEYKRHGNPPSDHIPDFNGVEEEWADACIRMMDSGQVDGVRLAEAIIAKIEFNRGRDRKHGGKLF